MKTVAALQWTRRILMALVLVLSLPLQAANYQLLGWNNLGMHCMDSDYSVFSVLPPYNTIECQLIANGLLVTNTGYRVTYEAVADPDGSFNSTAMGKGNFYTYVGPLYGANSLAPEMGLAGWAMPGPANTPQEMLFEPTNHPAAGVATLVNWFRAEGIPLSPYDDALHKNPYPLMRLIAWDSANQPLATNDIVLPVSDEMDCRACHGSGTHTAARPAAGWVWDGMQERDFRLNILRLHDERQFALHADLYNSALAARGFNSMGLYRSVTVDGKPVLCAICHASEALGIASYSNTPPLTASVHGFHAHVMDPTLGVTLDNSLNRQACYRCHPGSTTRCLRGAMGGAVAADGKLEMQCQNCHGNMSQVGSPNRVGWFMEPACQSCHTGTATSNGGQIRYTSVFADTNWTVRKALDLTFATQPDTPAPGISLYRFSAGHGRLQCEACHGSTHAEFPSTHRNDNLRNIAIQGHAGVMVECTACHVSTPNTPDGGPHGMHPVGQAWVSGEGITGHNDWISFVPGGVASCQACHGLEYRGTVLSRAKANRTLTANFDAASVTVQLFPGAIVGCYTCHNGPGNGDYNPSVAPTVSDVSTNTTNDQSVSIVLPATSAPSTLRIISQPANGLVGVAGNVATYHPNPGFVGTDTFTFAAYDGAKNSSLATATVSVTAGPVSVAVTGYGPPSVPALWPAAFAAVSTVANSVGPVTYNWNFGDSSATSAEQFPNHSYSTAGTYTWTVTVTVAGIAAVDAGLIQVGSPMQLTSSQAPGAITLSWPDTAGDTILEQNGSLGSQGWMWVTNAPVVSGGVKSITVPVAGTQFFRVRRPW